MQNVVLLVLDSLRGDHIAEHAPAIAGLAEDNLFFEQAVAPSRWSLPSHASIFSGLAPHEHGLHTMDDEFDGVPLVDRLNERGYSTFGASANPFCSGAYGFEDPFDDFRYTLDKRLSRGIDVSDVTGSSDADGNRKNAFRRYGRLVRAVLKHDARLASLYNVGFSAVRKAVSDVAWLQRLPHPLFQSSTVYLYDPDRNTRAIDRYVEERTDGEQFFVFSNYMDTHRPYYPSASYQRQKLGTTLSFREIKRVNEDVGRPQVFAAREAQGTVDETDLDRVRKLYAGTVSEVDAHVERLIQTLEREGLRDDTLVVITADHGEALGERGPRGNRRMGHVDTVSDHVLTVPLLFANPSLEPVDVQEYVPLTALYDVLASELPTTSSEIVDRLVTDEQVVAECLATESTWDEDDRVDLPADFERRQTEEHTCVMYNSEQKLAIDTGDGRWAWSDGKAVDVDALDPELEEACRSRLYAIEEALTRRGAAGSTDREDDVESQLEALGYI